MTDYENYLAELAADRAERIKVMCEAQGSHTWNHHYIGAVCSLCGITDEEWRKQGKK